MRQYLAPTCLRPPKAAAWILKRGDGGLTGEILSCVSRRGNICVQEFSRFRAAVREQERELAIPPPHPCFPPTAAAAGGKNHKTTKRLPLHNPRVVYSITNYGNSLRLQLAGRLYRPRRTVKTRIYAAFECHPEDGAPLITQREQNRQKRGMGRGGVHVRVVQCSAV